VSFKIHPASWLSDPVMFQVILYKFKINICSFISEFINLSSKKIYITQNIMKKHLLFTLVLIFVFSLNSNAQKVKVDFDKNADFSKYKTFQFLEWQENIDQILNDFDKKRIRDAFKSELDSRNLEMVDSDPDIVFSLYLVVDQKTSVTGYTNYYGGGYGRGYRRGGWGWGGGHSTTNYTEDDYLQGTMVLDVYDGKTKDLAWQAAGVKTIQEKPEKREKSIPKSVKKMMKKFPIGPVK